MLIDAEKLQNDSPVQAEIVVVGAGPAGIVLALELAQAGLDVVLLESGRLNVAAAAQELGAAQNFDPQVHAPMTECTRRQVGGTSVIWGGRCVPYDRVDFDQRDYIPHSAWDVTYEELAAYFPRACDYFRCGQSVFDVHQLANIEQKTIVPGLPDTHVLTSTLERWSLPTNFGKEYLTELQRSAQIRLIYGLTCVEITTPESGQVVEALQCKTLTGKPIVIQARKYILAGGALNTTRLLLASDQHHPGGIGNHSGLLGKFYMGHLSGDIATVHFTTPPEKTVFGFDRDPDQIYVRRRFSFSREFLHEQELTNIVAWLGVPPFADPAHGNGILSLAYLALNFPILGQYLTAKAIKKSLLGKDSGLYLAHLMNLLKDMGQVLTFAPNFGYGRYFANRKIPALFVYSAANDYPLHYHSEQVPNPNSCVSLADERDALGMRRLNINLQFSQQDIDSVVRAHTYWDQHLRDHDCGYLNYSTDDPEASVWAQAGDGFHQVGTTRMAADPGQGVVGTGCNVHGFEDLFVTSSSMFTTSGQANSTFMIVAFALRLADDLKRSGIKDERAPSLTQPDGACSVEETAKI